MNEDFIKYNSKMDRPIPGESLTNDPENPYPWEKPTEFTNVVKASEYLFERSEEHTSALQSPCNIVCRLLLEKKNNTKSTLAPPAHLKSAP